MTARPVRWGMLATGSIAHDVAGDLRLVGNGDLVAVGSRSEERARRFARAHGIERAHGSYEALIGDPDVEAIYIATPHPMHADNAAAALRAGKAVLCEKPLTTSPDDARRLFDIARDQGCYLLEAMWTYFLPALDRARAWIDEGRIGEVTHLRADFGYAAPFDATSRLYDPALGGGAVLDIGIYVLALAWRILGRHPERFDVVGRLAASGVEDDVSLHLDYGDVTAHLTASFRCQLPNAATIVGREGTLVLPEFWHATSCLRYESGSCVERFDEERAGLGYTHQLEAAGRDIRAGRVESEVVPWATSLVLSEQMAAIRARILPDLSGR